MTRTNDPGNFMSDIGQKEKRKLRAKRTGSSVWRGFGLFGIVGWTLVVPTLLGAIAGRWLDRKYPQSFSWTLTGLITGLLLGGIMVWRWIRKEKGEIDKNQEDNHE